MPNVRQKERIAIFGGRNDYFARKCFMKDKQMAKDNGYRKRPKMGIKATKSNTNQGKWLNIIRVTTAKVLETTTKVYFVLNRNQ